MAQLLLCLAAVLFCSAVQALGGYNPSNPDYACQNKANPTITCGVITPLMCQTLAWMPTIASECPNVCGFCRAGPIKTCKLMGPSIGNSCTTKELTPMGKHCVQCTSGVPTSCSMANTTGPFLGGDCPPGSLSIITGLGPRDDILGNGLCANC